MLATLTINLAGPIKTARISDCGAPSAGWSPGATVAGVNSESDGQKAALAQANRMLRNVADKLSEFCNGAFSAHKEEIAKLSVEIARKILARKVANGDYEIESIVEEALSNAPTRQDIVVHLNPDDLSQYQNLQEDEAREDFAGIKFVPDAKIGRAECLLETPKGIIESLIDQHLEQVGNALTKATR